MSDISVVQGRKDDVGKLRWDLLPPYAMMKVVEVYTIGSKKYNDRNWEKGLKWGRVFAAMMRHAWNWWAGQRNDPVDGQHHLASVVWCALALMQYEQTHPELDDRKDGFQDEPLPAVESVHSQSVAGPGRQHTNQDCLRSEGSTGDINVVDPT